MFDKFMIRRGIVHTYNIYVCASVELKILRCTESSNQNDKSFYSKTEEKHAATLDRGFILALLCDSLLLYRMKQRKIISKLNYRILLMI